MSKFSNVLKNDSMYTERALMSHEIRTAATSVLLTNLSK